MYGLKSFQTFSLANDNKFKGNKLYKMCAYACCLQTSQHTYHPQIKNTLIPADIVEALTE